MTATVFATFTYSRDEYLRAMRRHYTSTLHVRRDVIGGVLAVAGGLYLALATNAAVLGWVLAAVGIALLGLVSYTFLLLPRLSYGCQPRLKDEYSLCFSDQGIAFKTAEIDSTLQWSVYHAWLSDREFYLLYHGKRDVTVVPRRVLNDGDDARFRDLLTRQIGEPRT